MTDEEQKRIFSKNLSKYIELSGKEQKEIAKDLGFPATTFNTWCVGKIIPSMGKVQKIADYFGIGKSDLLDDKYSADLAIQSARMNKNEQATRLLSYFIQLPQEQKDMIETMVKSLYDKNKE